MIHRNQRLSGKLSSRCPSKHYEATRNPTTGTARPAASSTRPAPCARSVRNARPRKRGSRTRPVTDATLNLRGRIPDVQPDDMRRLARRPNRQRRRYGALRSRPLPDVENAERKLAMLAPEAASRRRPRRPEYQRIALLRIHRAPCDLGGCDLAVSVLANAGSILTLVAP